MTSWSRIIERSKDEAKQGFREFQAARRTIEGYEAMHMIRKAQARWVSGDEVRKQNQFIDKLFDLPAWDLATEFISGRILSPPSKLQHIRAHKDDIDVILLDLTLPGLSSREVFEEALRLRPDLKVVLTSAYSKETVDASFTGLRITHFIRKPFQLSELGGVLEDALSV